MGVKVVYPAGLRPPVLVLCLHEALVLSVRHQVRQSELLLVVELAAADPADRAAAPGNDDVGPVGPADLHAQPAAVAAAEVVHALVLKVMKAHCESLEKQRKEPFGIVLKQRFFSRLFGRSPMRQSRLAPIPLRVKLLLQAQDALYRVEMTLMKTKRLWWLCGKQ